MSEPLLSRPALFRVTRALLTAELRAARGRSRRDDGGPSTADWREAMPLGAGGLGCDSLELLSIAAAANEMFHLHAAGMEANLLSAPLFGDWLDVVEAAWRAGGDRVTFMTSGTTGLPKRCTRPAAHLRVEVDALADRWSGRRRVVALTPAHHIYGLLFTAMLPDRLGVPCLGAEDLSPAALVAELRPGDLVVSFPERWAFLERSLPAWPRNVEGVVSTAPCPPEVLAGLTERGLGRMTEVYGSSETAGVAWRDDPSAPHALMPQWRSISVAEDGSSVLRHADGSDHAMMDRVVSMGERSFALAGRRDGMVQVGGVNVSPGAVADRLRTRPGVRWASVRLMRPEEGRRLKAFLLPEAGVDGDALRREVEDWASLTLPAVERPASVTIGYGDAAEVPAKGFDW